MNKGHKVQKNKLKTLPNQLTTNHQEFLFQSTCEEDFSNRLNLASPTFATNDLKSVGDGYSQKQNKFSNIKMSTAEFFKAQNEKLANKCEEYKKMIIELEDKLKETYGKLETSKHVLQKKVKEATKMSMLRNSSKELSNIDIYIQMQTFREDYRNCKEQSQNMKKQNIELERKVNQLELIITNYTSKSEKKGKKDSQVAEKLEHKYQLEMEELKRVHQIKFKQLENQKKQKEKQSKKWKQDYEKLKFLKEQIEKKRQQDIKAREEMQKQIDKQNKQISEAAQKIMSLKRQIQTLNNKKQQIQNKLSIYQKNNEQIEQQRGEVQKLELDLIQLETEQKKLRTKLQLQSKQNKKLNQEISELGKQRDRLQSEIENLQKCKIEYEQKTSKRIQELEKQVSQTENQCLGMKEQFQKWMEEHKNGSKNEINMIESRFQENIQDLKKDIEDMKKMKQTLEGELETERQKCSRISEQLQNTYRKIQQNSQIKEPYRRNQMMTQEIPFRHNKTIATKTLSQLKMVQNILSGILGIEDFESNKIKCGANLGKDQYIENIVTQMAKQAEQLADIYDSLENQIDSLKQQIKNKEQVISKLLKFTPHEKKNQILEYLNVMEKIQQYTTQQIYKATRDIEEEANDWKKYISQLFSTLDRNQEQLQYLKKMVNKGREPLRQYVNQQRYPQKTDGQRRRFGQY